MIREKETIDFAIMRHLLSNSLSKQEYADLCVRLFEQTYETGKQNDEAKK